MMTKENFKLGLDGHKEASRTFGLILFCLNTRWPTIAACQALSNRLWDMQK